MVSDVSGSPRGKILPASKFLRAIGERGLRIPESIFGLTVTGDYIEEHDLNPRASDVYLRPAPESIRVVPWYKEPTAPVICDAFYFDGAPVDVAPRPVLRRVMDLYADRGWQEMLAPELEFFTGKINGDPDYHLEPPPRRSA